jgi:hypothetical protein
MKQAGIILSSFLGTTAMTGYSHAVSAIKGYDFSEPRLLGKMARSLSRSKTKKESMVVGWCLHYLVGLLFAESYYPLYKQSFRQHPLRGGLVVGGLSGLAAILIWKFTVEAHPAPPAMNFPRFAGQLFLAHVVFGLVTMIGFSAADRWLKTER